MASASPVTDANELDRATEFARAVDTLGGRAFIAGENFTVYTLGQVDVSLPRTDSKTGPGHPASRCEAMPCCPSRSAIASSYLMR